MKKFIFIILLTFDSFLSEAQVLQEWFNQKATEKKYLMQQVAALQVYIKYLKKGYSIANKGLTTISSLKDGHLNLDKDFFNSFKDINPRIKKYTAVAEIIALQSQILKSCKTIKYEMKQSENFTSGEMSYINNVVSRLIISCENIIDGLTTILEPGKLTMADGERLARIDAMHNEMQESNTWIQSFQNDLKMLALQRSKEMWDAKSIQSLYGNK